MPSPCLLLLGILCLKPLPPTGKLVYAKLAPGEAQSEDDEGLDLYLKGIPEGRERRLTDHRRSQSHFGGSMREVSFSPDGRRVAFLAEATDSHLYLWRQRTGDSAHQGLRLWVLNLGTGAVQRLDAGRENWRLPVWSHDSDSLLAISTGYMGEGPGTKESLFLFDVQSGRATALFQARRISGITWSADDAQVIYQGSNGKGSAASSAKVIVKSLRPRRAPYPVIDSLQVGQIAASSGGALLTWSERELSVFQGSHSIYKAEPSMPRRAFGIFGPVVWDPSGTRLASAVTGGDGSILQVANLKTGAVRTVSNLGGVNYLRWSRNPSWLVVRDPEALLAIPLSGGPPEKLTELPNDVSTLDWWEPRPKG